MQLELEPHSYVRIITRDRDRLGGDDHLDVGVITRHSNDGTSYFVERLTGQYAKSDMKHGGVLFQPHEVEPIEPVYPELDKMSAVKGESQIIGAFLDWLRNDKHRTICESGRYDDYVPVYASIEVMLAEYFDIDLTLVERDRSRYLEDFTRNANRMEAA